MSRRRAAAAALLALLSLRGAAGCSRRGPRAASNASIAALVGDRPVPYADYVAYVKGATGDDPRDIAPRVASSLLDQYLEELLLERATEDALPKLNGKAPAERRRELIARRARLDSIGDAELREAYDGHPERYRRPAIIRMSQLLLPSKETADEAVRRLKSGAPWADVSRELSVAPNASSGGSLGLLGKSDLPHDFERAVWGLPAGGTTSVLAAPHGFHVFRVEERFEERTIPFEDAAPALRLAVAEERSSAALSAILAEGRKVHPVAVVEEHLPFPYVGGSPRQAFR